LISAARLATILSQAGDVDFAMQRHVVTQKRVTGHVRLAPAVLMFDSFPSAFQRTDAPGETENPGGDIWRESQDNIEATS